MTKVHGASQMLMQSARDAPGPGELPSERGDHGGVAREGELLALQHGFRGVEHRVVGPGRGEVGMVFVEQESRGLEGTGLGARIDLALQDDEHVDVGVRSTFSTGVGAVEDDSGQPVAVDLFQFCAKFAGGLADGGVHGSQYSEIGRESAPRRRGRRSGG